MKLLDGKAGRSYEVVEVSLGLALERRLEALGLLPGTTVKILHKKTGGALIIVIRGARFAVGRGISSCISVKEAD